MCWPGPAEGRLLHSKYRLPAYPGSREVCLASALFPLIVGLCPLPSAFSTPGFPGRPQSRLFFGSRA